MLLAVLCVPHQGLLHAAYPATERTLQALQAPFKPSSLSLTASASRDAVSSALASMDAAAGNAAVQLQGCVRLMDALPDAEAVAAVVADWSMVIRLCNALVHALGDHTATPGVVSAVCGVIELLTHSNSVLCTQLQQLGCTASLIRACTSVEADASAVTATVRALWSLLTFTQDKSTSWVDGLFRTLTRCMSQHIGSAEVQRVSCAALASLALWDLGGGVDDGTSPLPATSTPSGSRASADATPKSRINNVFGEEGLGLVLFGVYVALDSFVKDEGVQSQGLLALANLAVHPLAQVSIAELGTWLLLPLRAAHRRAAA
jgi:hypothetical protein